MKLARQLLLEVLSEPERVATLSLHEWDSLIRAARAEGLLGRLATVADELGLLAEVAQPARDHLLADATLAADHERTVRWEINRLERALGSIPGPIVLLKGAAYVAAALPAARGR